MIKYNGLNFKNDIDSFSNELQDNIKSFSVLVIGGAGTIGSNYLKEILVFKPKRIVVVDINENGLTELTRDLRSSDLMDYDPEYTSYPVNLLSSTFDKIFFKHHFDVVANFSAHKHVRSEKDNISIEALIKNNVYGAIKLLKLCDINKPKYFFSVSTDKAANPVNIMGASKAIMEKLILSKQKEYRVSTARFANVAFSNGSLLDGFNYRLRKQQPLSCPSDIKRFFVTPKQSGQICLLATFLGESGNIFFPKLDFYKDQIFFKEIALKFLEEKGFEPLICVTEEEAKSFQFVNSSKKYPIYFFNSDTSGEKSFEEFYTEEENYNLEKYHTLGFIKSNDVKISFSKLIDSFDSIFNNRKVSKSEIITFIKQIIPNFSHIEKGKNLDQKM